MSLVGIQLVYALLIAVKCKGLYCNSMVVASWSYRYSLASDWSQVLPSFFHFWHWTIYFGAGFSFITCFDIPVDNYLSLFVATYIFFMVINLLICVRDTYYLCTYMFMVKVNVLFCLLKKFEFCTRP